MTGPVTGLVTGFLAALLIVALASTATLGDTVELVDGSRVEGKVVDLGGNAIVVGIRHGRKKILKRDILRISFTADAVERPVLQQDLVIRRDGSDLAGSVRYSQDGRSVIVDLPDGSSVSLRRRDVMKVIFRNEKGRETDDTLVYSKDLEQRIEQTILELESEDASLADRAERRLGAYGIFCIPRIESLLHTSPADGEAPLGARTRKALEHVLRLHDMKKLVSPRVEAWEPRIYEIFTSGSVDHRQKVVEGLLLPQHVDDALLFLRFLLLDDREDFRVRSHIVGMLQGLQSNTELVQLYRRSSGKLQMVLAIALGRNRVLVGAPTLIEGLSMPDRKVRRQAIRWLTEFTGQNLGFDADDTPSARRQAVAAWNAWWKENNEGVFRQTESLLAGSEVDSDERRRAKELLIQAGAEMEDGRLEDAEHLLREAVRKDPIFLNARIHLAVLLYTSKNDPVGARRVLEELVNRRLPGIAEQSLAWVHYHLGKISEIQTRGDDAITEYQRCLAADPNFYRASMALGELLFLRATRSEVLKSSERKSELRLALEKFAMATSRIERSQEELVLLYREDLPVGELPAVNMREHNSRVVHVRADLRLAQARCLLGVAKVQSLLGDAQKAVRAVATAIEVIEEDPGSQVQTTLLKLREYLALLYENQGRHASAYREYRKILKEIDPQNGVALKGLERTGRKVSRRPDGAGSTARTREGARGRLR